MTLINTLIAMPLGLWLFSCAASVVALYWTIVARAPQYRMALVSSCVALLTAYCGLSRVQFRASKTVNGHVEWSVDSRWFFTGALILAGVALALTLWHWRRASSRLAVG